MVILILPILTTQKLRHKYHNIIHNLRSTCSLVIIVLTLFIWTQSYHIFLWTNLPCQWIILYLEHFILYWIFSSILIVRRSYSHSMIRIYRYTTKKMMAVKCYLILIWWMFFYLWILRFETPYFFLKLPWKIALEIIEQSFEIGWVTYVTLR